MAINTVDTNTTQLIINTLTQAQYDQALSEGNINETELYMITDNDDNYVTVEQMNTAIAEAIAEAFANIPRAENTSF